MNIPNILTVFRLLAAPMVGLVFVTLPSPYAEWLALVLFIAAALTDYLDGFLARRWDQITNLGRMLDPIADKAMVLIVLLVIAVRAPFISVVTPIILIMFREVFVSGLREFLGEKAGSLQVTKLAKWKTASQMLAVVVVLASFLFGYYYSAYSWSLDDEMIIAILAEEMADEFGLRWIIPGYDWSNYIGVWLLWIAAGLTVITGLDYFRKALPILKEI